MAIDRSPVIALVSLLISSCLFGDGVEPIVPDPERPTAMSDHAMIYDTARDRTVLFGGEWYKTGVNTVVLDETWEHDQRGWSKLAIAGPAARTRHAMAYDRDRGVAVLFSGNWCLESNTAGLCDDQWTYDGVWRRIEVDRPAARFGHAMAYDAARGVTVMFGGAVGQDELVPPETWAWDGSTWTKAGTAPDDFRRAYHSMWYDPVQQEVVAFGGWNDGPLQDTIAWDGTSWRRIASDGPVPRVFAGSSWSPTHGGAILFGGDALEVGTGCDTTESRFCSDTWLFADGAWSELDVGAPPPRGGHRLVFDEGRGRVLSQGSIGMFVGPRARDCRDGTCQETWALDDTGWVHLEESLAP